jgi:hypothetical protein
MPLTKPALAAAEPGMPITAQSWNAIVDGVDDLYDAVLALGSAVVTVAVTLTDVPVSTALVVAEPLDGEGFEVAAIPPIGPRTTHLLAGLTPGQWRVRISATGLNEETRDIEVPRDEPLSVAMEAAGAVVPDLFGVGLSAALGTLGEGGIPPDRVRVVDASGGEVSPHDVPPAHRNSDVLVQTPGPGAVLVSATQTVRLVVAAPLVEAETVTMPSLIGLTYDELVRTLTTLGLRVGRTTVRSS